MLVLVNVLEPGLVHVRVRMCIVTVLMVVRVLDMLVIVARVGMHVRLSVVLVLVGVRTVVRVLVGHVAPSVVVGDGGRTSSGSPACR